MYSILLLSATLLTYFSPVLTSQALIDTINRENMKIVLDSSVSMNVYPTTLGNTGGWVKVTWQYVDDPSEDDWVGLYSPPTSDDYGIDPSEHAPIRLLMANYSSSHLTSGQGYLQFKVMNMRAPIIFGFFQGGLDDATLVAVSSTVTFKNYNQPLQGHLALTDDPTEMVFQWVTKNKKKPVVYYGTSSGSYDYVAKATTTTYNASDMCGSPATDWGWRDPGLLHTVLMEGLTPGKKYYYIFGDYYAWSQEYSFKTAPKVGADVTTTVISYGDMGCGEVDNSFFIKEDIQPDSMNTTNLIYKMVDNVSFVFHIGDISYARGFSAVWDIFFNQIEPIATRVPYMVCVGNHERNWYYTYPGIFNNSDSGGECGLPHYLRFPMPRTGFDKPWLVTEVVYEISRSSPSPRRSRLICFFLFCFVCLFVVLFLLVRFGFDYGQVHFVVMSTEHDFSRGTDQHYWISKHLANVDRSTTPWLIFVGHRPMYIGSKEGEHLDLAEELQEHIEGLLYTYNVTIAMWAHVHCYQRTCPVYQGVCTDGAPIHVVIGMGGRDLAGGAAPDSYEDWMVVSDFSYYGFTKLTANSTTLVWEYIHNDDNKVYDKIVLTSSYGFGRAKEKNTNSAEDVDHSPQMSPNEL